MASVRATFWGVSLFILFQFFMFEGLLNKIIISLALDGCVMIIASEAYTIYLLIFNARPWNNCYTSQDSFKGISQEFPLRKFFKTCGSKTRLYNERQWNL